MSQLVPLKMSFLILCDRGAEWGLGRKPLPRLTAGNRSSPLGASTRLEAVPYISTGKGAQRACLRDRRVCWHRRGLLPPSCPAGLYS